MPNPGMDKATYDKRVAVIEQCLREGFTPPGIVGGRGAAIMEASKRLQSANPTIYNGLKVGSRKGWPQPDWSIYQPTPAPEPGNVLEQWAPEHPIRAPIPPPAYVHGPAVEYVSRPDGTYVFGAVGDTHLGSKYERMDVLNDLYDRFATEGVDRVFHTGNWIDGEAKFNAHDLHTHGFDAQCRYLAKQYPQRQGISTYAVAGDDHEGWYAQREGIDVGRYAQQCFRDAGRLDWHDLGYMEAHVILKHAVTGARAIMAVVHPGGGSAYADSYTVQKIIESLDGGEKPAVALYGHYHKLMAGEYRNVWWCQTGCTQDQTPFARKKRLRFAVGGALIKLEQDAETGAIISMTPTLRRYFNRGYYNERWSHHGPVNLPMRTA